MLHIPAYCHSTPTSFLWSCARLFRACIVISYLGLCRICRHNLGKRKHRAKKKKKNNNIIWFLFLACMILLFTTHQRSWVRKTCTMTSTQSDVLNLVTLTALIINCMPYVTLSTCRVHASSKKQHRQDSFSKFQGLTQFDITQCHQLQSPHCMWKCVYKHG